MSVVLSLTSAAIIAGVSITSLSVTQLIENKTGVGKRKNPCFETIFVDGELLKKTLTDYGCCIKQVSTNEFVVETNNGELRYFRNADAEAFQLELRSVENVDLLLEQIRLFETEYGRNVQTYTYHHIMENLSEDMNVVSEQVLEDDSLMLTISI